MFHVIMIVIMRIIKKHYLLKLYEPKLHQTALLQLMKSIILYLKVYTIYSTIGKKKREKLWLRQKDRFLNNSHIRMHYKKNIYIQNT